MLKNRPLSRPRETPLSLVHLQSHGAGRAGAVIVPAMPRSTSVPRRSMMRSLRRGQVLTSLASARPVRAVGEWARPTARTALVCSRHRGRREPRTPLDGWTRYLVMLPVWGCSWALPRCSLWRASRSASVVAGSSRRTWPKVVLHFIELADVCSRPCSTLCRSGSSSCSSTIRIRCRRGWRSHARRPRRLVGVVIVVLAVTFLGQALPGAAPVDIAYQESGSPSSSRRWRTSCHGAHEAAVVRQNAHSGCGLTCPADRRDNATVGQSNSTPHHSRSTSRSRRSMS
jgi:hypothetical protein